MFVYALIDRGHLVAVFSTAEAAKARYTRNIAYIKVIPTWNEYHSDWFVDKDCKVGEVSVEKLQVCDE